MKVYVSVDIEGVAGITLAEEATPGRAEIKYFQEQMTAEAVAACEGAMAAGATAIVVKDAHWTGCNIDPKQLPHCARLVRGWSGHPYSMMEGLDASFDAVCYVGYHARAGSSGNPLAHTLSSSVVYEMRINDEPMSEFRLNTYTAEMLGVPVAFLSGDEAICREVTAFNPQIVTYATMTGTGSGTESVQPDLAIASIKNSVAEALTGDLMAKRKKNPDQFTIEIDYVKPRVAYGKSFYPNAQLVNEKTVRFTSGSYLDILKMIHFCV